MRNLIDRITIWVDGLSDGQRRALLAGLLLLVALFIAFILYWVFFRSLFSTGPGEETLNVNGELITRDQLPELLKNLDTDAELTEELAGALPSGADFRALGGLTIATPLDVNLDQIELSGSGDTLVGYESDTGRFATVDENGNIVYRDAVIHGVEEITWSNDTNKAVLELEDGFNIVYDFNTNKQYSLDPEMTDFDFSPNDNQVSFKYEPDNPQDRWLGVIGTDGSGVQQITRLGENGDKVNLQWSPSGQSPGTFSEFTGAESQEVYILGFRGENFKSINVNGSGFDYQWSPNGRQMIYSTYDSSNNYNDQLHIVDSSGNEIGDNHSELGINTSAEKCTFNSLGDSVYCAVPVDPPVGGGISPEVLNDVEHDFYRIDLNSGVAIKIATPVDPITGTSVNAPSDVMVSEDEDLLYYTEAETGTLRRLILE